MTPYIATFESRSKHGSPLQVPKDLLEILRIRSRASKDQRDRLDNPGQLVIKDPTARTLTKELMANLAVSDHPDLKETTETKVYTRRTETWSQ